MAHSVRNPLKVSKNVLVGMALASATVLHGGATSTLAAEQGARVAAPRDPLAVVDRQSSTFAAGVRTVAQAEAEPGDDRVNDVVQAEIGDDRGNRATEAGNDRGNNSGNSGNNYSSGGNSSNSNNGGGNDDGGNSGGNDGGGNDGGNDGGGNSGNSGGGNSGGGNSGSGGGNR